MVLITIKNVKWLVKFTSANLYHGGRREVWFRVLYGVRRTHNIFRDEDSLRTWAIYVIMRTRHVI